MQGLEIARRYCEEWGAPYLRQRFPVLARRMAAGLFRGSQVLGADDEWSRDHGWGPMFTLFLTEDAYAAQGEEVQRALDENAPRAWLGARYTDSSPNITVTTLDRYLIHWLGYAQPPVAWRDWLGGSPNSGAREGELYLICHGAIFLDPDGEIAARRAVFAHYPEPAWLSRVWEEVFHIWHYGQYNLCERLVHRDDPVATQIALGELVERVMRFSLLLGGDYTPYWKWLAHEFRKLPDIAALDTALRDVCAPPAPEELARRVGAICDHVHEMLEGAGLASHKAYGHPHTLFRDQAAIQSRLDALTQVDS